MTAIETANMAALPKDFAAIPRLALTFSTPLLIEPLDRLTPHLGQGGEPSARVFACREDMNSGLGGGGGNKLRKLEYGKPNQAACLSRASPTSSQILRQYWPTQ